MPKPDFNVGDWTAIPARRLLRAGDQEVTLEPRVMDLLICLAEHAGEVVGADQLVDEVWHGTIVSDSPIYQTLAKLRKALGDDSHSPRYIQTIAKRGYRLIADVAWEDPSSAAAADGGGEPVGGAAATTTPSAPGPGRAAAASSATASTDGHAFAAGAPTASAPPDRGRIRRHAPLALLLVTTLYVLMATSDVATSVPVRGADAAREMSIAVLPFADMSEDGSKAYLGDGLAEQLIHTLSALPELKVIARTSSFAFRDTDDDAVTIAGQLGVEMVLEGSVRTAGDQIRVSAQLIDGSDGFHVWSRIFEQPIGDVFDIQDSIAREVAGLIVGGEVLARIPPVRQATHDPEAWALYLLGHHQWEMRRADTLAKAIAYFEQAVSLDPGFALAYAELSFVYFLSSEARYGTLADDEAIDRAEQAVHQALALDPRLPEAWTALQAVRSARGDTAGANAAAERAYELNPGSAKTSADFAGYLFQQGRHEEALALMERAVELDPLSAVLRSNLANWYRLAGMAERGAPQLDKAMELAPDWHMPFTTAAYIAYFAGEFDLAVRHGAHAATVEGPHARLADSAAWLTANAWLSLGDFEAARAWLEYARAGGKPQWWIDQAEIRILLAEGRDPEAHALLDHWATQIPTDEDCCLWHRMLNSNADAWGFAAYVELILGHDQHALAYFDRIGDLGEAGGDDALTRDQMDWGYLPSSWRAWLADRHGDRATAERLAEESVARLAPLTEALAGRPGVAVALAVAESARGNQDRAVPWLQRAADAGWGRRWVLERDPALAKLKRRTEYGAIVARVDEALATQRARVDDDPALDRPPPIRR